MIEVRPLGLGGLLEIVPRRFGDARGSFTETYNRAALAGHGIVTEFVQDNEAYSAGKGVLRGLHYQLPPHAQDKLVRAVRGSVWDVAVDIRRGSPSFGRWAGIVLSEEAGNQLFVPQGFAHGYLTLGERAMVAYKVSAFYAPEHERCIRHDDPALAIEWPDTGGPPQLSAKDAQAPSLAEAELPEMAGHAPAGSPRP